jgi:hypothetical protein
VYDAGSGAWSLGGAIPRDAGSKDTGIVLLTNGTELLLFAVGADAANSVRYAKYAGGAWSGWTTLFGSPGARTFLSGSGCDVRSRAAIVWTDAVMGTNLAVGAEVTALF